MTGRQDPDAVQGCWCEGDACIPMDLWSGYPSQCECWISLSHTSFRDYSPFTRREVDILKVLDSHQKAQARHDALQHMGVTDAEIEGVIKKRFSLFYRPRTMVVLSGLCEVLRSD